MVFDLKPFILSVSLFYTPFSAANIANKPIRTAYDAAEYFQYSYEALAWAKVVYCKDMISFSGYSIDNCADAFDFLSLLQQSHENRGVFFEMHSNKSGQTEEIKDLLNRFDQKSNYYGLKVVKGPNCLDDCLIMKPDLNPPQGRVALMFAEKYSPSAGIVYEKMQITEMLSIFKENKKNLPDGRAFIVLNLNYLANSDLEMLRSSFTTQTPIIFYQYEGQILPDMNQAKNIVDALIKQGVKILYLVSKAVQLRLESQIPNADWSFWRADPVMQITSLGMFSRFLRSPKRLIELRTRNCILGEINRLAISRGECAVMMDYLLVQMIFSSYVALFECPDHNKCHWLDFKSSVNLPRLPFVLINVVNGPNSNGSAKDFLQKEDAAGPINYVIDFQEQPGKEKFYTKKHIDEVVKVMSKKKFKYNRGLHMRLDFLTKEKLADSDYFKPLLQHQKFQWLFVHNGEGFAEQNAEPTMSFTCHELKNIKHNIRAINRETYLLVDQEIRGKLFIKDDCREMASEETPVTPPTLPTKTTLFPPTTLAPIDDSVIFPVVHGESGESGGSRLLPISALCGLVMIFTRLIKFGD